MRIDLDETQRTGEPVAEQHQPTETEVEPEAKRTKRKTSTKRGWKSKKSVVKSKHKSKTKTEVKLRPDGLRQGSVAGALVDGVIAPRRRPTQPVCRNTQPSTE
jgi:hypothetical protein